MSDAVEVVLQTFRAVEQRDADGLLRLYHPEIEFHDAPSLPYGGSHYGLEAVLNANVAFAQTWDALQTEAERKMDPRVVADRGEEVVVLWRIRAVDDAGDRFDAPVLALYHVRDGKLARARMFHFDTAAIVSFLARAKVASSQ